MHDSSVGRKAVTNLTMLKSKFMAIVVTGLILGALNVSDVKAQQSSVQVRVQIAQVHTLIVNDSGNITKIISNSKDPNPDKFIIRLNSESGMLLDMSDEIRLQYDLLAQNNNLSGDGLVYSAVSPNIAFLSNYIFNSAGLVIGLKKRGYNTPLYQT